ncbi:MAG: succinate dehydrogenase assembly factor 2, partial [Janthinobacterium lividum]
KKINYQSNNRGYRENSIILSKFCNRFLKDMNLDELNNFDKLLNENDLDIYEWLTRKVPYPSTVDSKIMNRLLKLDFMNH